MLIATSYPLCNLEVWGGIECTINRVGNNFHDQLLDAGHYKRPGDLKAFAALGIRMLRYPILWERHQPQKDQGIEWGWTEEQLNTLRTLNIKPIAGLVHHGSGPAYTGLYEPDFADALAGYAHQVASRFPWIEYYTPVNEPLTTARFSGLYGFWYPHHQNGNSFATILVNQVKATVLSMQAIRKINPNAKLVQTEDLAKIHSTDLLSYQANFENERRWLSYDLLCGRVNREHYFWPWLLSHGITEAQLDFFIENPCVPDILGLNYYVTSERFLDEDINTHPGCAQGGNGIHTYADVAAARAACCTGLKNLLHEAWNRYQLPVAITEAHLNCTREEQMRWFKYVWDASCLARSEGIDVRAVTAWCLLGAYDWNSLLTRNEKIYETGVFDARNNKLRPTAIARLIKALATKGTYEHPVLEAQGWWQRGNTTSINKTDAPSPILIIGKNTLGRTFGRICEQRAIAYRLLLHQDVTIKNETEIEKAINQYKPWAIINATGFVQVNQAETNSRECFMINTGAPGFLAGVCRKHGIRFMTFSSDPVSDSIQPLNTYSKSKAEGEAINTALDLFIDEVEGTWHLCNDGKVTWAEFASDLAVRAHKCPVTVF